MELTFSEPISLPILLEGRLAYHEDKSLVNFPGEIWKEIKDFDYYFVSNYGRVISDKRNFPIVLGQSVNKGQCRVIMHMNNKAFTKIVSKLVGNAFIGSKKENGQWFHKNAISTDNRVNNLIELDWTQGFYFNMENGKYEHSSSNFHVTEKKYNEGKNLLYCSTDGSYNGEYTYSELKKLIGENKAKHVSAALYSVKTGRKKSTIVKWAYKEN